MTIPNRVTLDHLGDMPVDDIAGLPVDQLLLLQEDIAAATASLQTAKSRLESALTLRYGARAAEIRRQSGKDTGTVRIQDGPVTVAAELPKKVDWDQAMLADLVARIRTHGNDPDEYVTTEFKVSERKYTAWPASIRAAFAPARTVRTGKASFQLIPTNEEASR